MGSLLLHNPWVQCYLLYVGAMWIALICDFLRVRWPPKTAPRPG
jgi:hypothetical protein